MLHKLLRLAFALWLGWGVFWLLWVWATSEPWVRVGAYLVAGPLWLAGAGALACGIHLTEPRP